MKKKSAESGQTDNALSKTSSYSVTIRNLKKGKQYFVRMRAYKTLNDQTYYGAWSKSRLSKKIK